MEAVTGVVGVVNVPVISEGFRAGDIHAAVLGEAGNKGQIVSWSNVYVCLIAIRIPLRGVSMLPCRGCSIFPVTMATVQNAIAPSMINCLQGRSSAGAVCECMSEQVSE